MLNIRKFTGEAITSACDELVDNTSAAAGPATGIQPLQGIVNHVALIASGEGSTVRDAPA